MCASILYGTFQGMLTCLCTSAFAEFALGSIVLHFFVYNFLG